MIVGSFGMNMFSFVRNHQTIFQSGCATEFPLAVDETSCCCVFAPVFRVFSGWGCSHFMRCVVASHCCSNLCFLDDVLCGASLYATSHLFVFLVSFLLRYLTHFYSIVYFFIVVLSVICIF